MSSVSDVRQRPLRDLRISVTDRCNMRCPHCMPREVFGPDYAFLPRKDLLTFEEIHRAARVLAGLGVRKIRLTGGEPLLRQEVELLVEMLAGVPGLDDLGLTTNGILLPKLAPRLKQAGLHRVTVSLDSLDQDTLARMTDSAFTVEQVLAGIEAARSAELGVKVNAVVRRGFNDDQVLDLARHFRGTDIPLRFIEFMDVGNSNGWTLDQVVPGAEVHAAIHARHPLKPVPPRHPGEVAKRFRYADGEGEIGLITSVTRPFCGNCSRLRLSTDGKLFTCLFAAEGHDLRSVLRSGDDAAVRAFVETVWSGRRDNYSEERTAATPDLIRQRVEMSYIGG